MPDTAPDTPHPIPHTPAPAGYSPRADATWALARRDYLAGQSRTQVCDRYGLPRSTFNTRAAQEGWRRCDQPEPDPIPDDDPEADEPVDCAALAEDALVRVRRALRHGRAAEAASWMRLHEKLIARQEAEAERAARRARVAQARGSGGAADALAALRGRMTVLTGAVNLQMRLSRAFRAGRMLDHHFDNFSGLNNDAVRDLHAFVDATRPPPVDDADLACSDSNFSVSDDP